MEKEALMENRVVRLETIIENMATKEDIANLRTELMREMGRLENGMLKGGISLVLRILALLLPSVMQRRRLRGVLSALASIAHLLFQRVDRLLELEEPRGGESMNWNQYIFELSRA